MKTIPCLKTLWVTGLSVWLVACDGGTPGEGTVSQDDIPGWGFVYEAASASPSQAPRQRDVRPAAAESTTGAVYAFRWQDDPVTLQTVLSDVEGFKGGSAVLEWEAVQGEFRAEYRGSLALVKRSGERWQVQLFDGSGETPKVRRVSDFAADEVCFWPSQEDGALTIQTAGPDGQCGGLNDDNEYFIVHVAMSETRSAIAGKVVASVVAVSQDVSAMGVSDSGSVVRRYLTLEEFTPTGGYRLYSRDAQMDVRREEPLLEGIAKATALVYSPWDGTALIQVKSPDSTVQGVYWYDVVADTLTKTPLPYAVEYEFAKTSSGVKQTDTGERVFFVAESSDDGLDLWELPTTPQEGVSLTAPWSPQYTDEAGDVYGVDQLWHPGLVTPDSPEVFAKLRHFGNSHQQGVAAINLLSSAVTLNIMADLVEICGLKAVAEQFKSSAYILANLSMYLLLNNKLEKLGEGEAGRQCAGGQIPSLALVPRPLVSLGVFAALSNPTPNGGYRHEVAYWGQNGEKRTLFDIVSSMTNFYASVYMFGAMGYAFLDGAGGMSGAHKVVQRSDGSFETAKIPQQHGGEQFPF